MSAHALDIVGRHGVWSAGGAIGRRCPPKESAQRRRLLAPPRPTPAAAVCDVWLCRRLPRGPAPRRRPKGVVVQCAVMCVVVGGGGGEGVGGGGGGGRGRMCLLGWQASTTRHLCWLCAVVLQGAGGGVEPAKEDLGGAKAAVSSMHSFLPRFSAHISCARPHSSLCQGVLQPRHQFAGHVRAPVWWVGWWVGGWADQRVIACTGEPGSTPFFTHRVLCSFPHHRLCAPLQATSSSSRWRIPKAPRLPPPWPLLTHSCRWVPCCCRCAAGASRLRRSPVALPLLPASHVMHWGRRRIGVQLPPSSCAPPPPPPPPPTHPPTHPPPHPTTRELS